MNDSVTDQRFPPDPTPRLLRFMVNAKPCYALKWRDERTEHRREVNYVLREAASDEIRCLLVDGPLRIAGFPELVSVQSTGRTLERAGTEWELALTIWADGAVDDEGMIRVCPPETFRGRSEYLRDDLKRLIREYRAGMRECYAPTLTAPSAPRLAATDTARIERRLDGLTAAVQEVGRPRVDSPAPVSANMLRRELAPVVEAVKAFGQKVTQELDDVVPHIAADRHKAQLAWIQKAEGCSDIERKAALLETEGFSRPEIAKRLPHKQGKAMTREGVRQALLRFERKTGQHGMFTRTSYRQNERDKAEAKEADEESET